MSNDAQSFASRVIDDLGGTTKTAAICDVTAGAVSQWRRTGIPKTQLRFLRATHPGIFDEVRLVVVQNKPD